ncbi:MAG: PLP-dependent aminotransferase family protein [bacterium]
MDFAIDRDSAVPIYLQIVRRIRDGIVSGQLEEGYLLPPERRLARELGVNRSTVLNAYNELKRNGFVAAHVGRGTAVLPRSLPEDLTGTGRSMPWRQLFREGSARTFDPLLRDLLELSERDDVIPMAIGLPAPDLLPLDRYRELVAEVTREIGPASLLHCPTEGITPLRETLSDWMGERGIHTDPGEMLVLSGSQQGLNLAARVFVDPGDTVIVEDPTYIGALQTFRMAGARLVSVPCDEAGLRTDILASLLERHRPKLIYTLPTFQNPSGTVMSLERRQQLLELALRHQVPIVEDDPYSLLHFQGEPVQPLKALDRHGVVIYLSTISKVLYPGLRLGWLVAPREVARQFTLAKQVMDLHSSTPAQWVVDRFLRRGYLDDHLATVRQVYRQRRDVMHAALSRRTPAGLQWRRPDGGFYIWLELPRDCERSRLLAHASEAGVSFLPGWFCFAADSERSFLRLNFTYPSEEQIKTGVSRLLTAIRQSSTRTRSGRKQEVGTPPVV